MHWLRSWPSAEEHAEAAVFVQQGDVVQMEVAEMEADAAEGIVEEEDAGGAEADVGVRKECKGVKKDHYY
jgi:hypothetical protein